MCDDAEQAGQKPGDDLNRLRERIRELESELAQEAERSESLRESEARRRTMSEAAFEGILIHERGVVIDANESFARMYGYRVDEMIGSDAIMLIAPEHRERVRSRINSGSAQPYKALCMRKDGSRFLAELRARTMPLCGREVRVGVVRDISEHEKTQERLQLLGQVTEQVVDSVIATDLNYKVIYANRAFLDLYGLTEEEILGQDPGFLDADPDAERIQKEINAAVSSGRVWHGERLNRRKDGSRLLVDVIVFPLFDRNGRVFAYAGSQRDITSRKEEEEQKRELEIKVLQTQKLESLGILAGGIAHDFNNLLTAVLGNAELALLDLPAESIARPMLEEIKKGAKRGAELATQMLAYSGRRTCSKQTVDLNEMVTELTHLMKSSVAKSAVLTLKLHDGLPGVQCDPTQIRQIIMNTLINASEALGGTRGSITVSTGVMECDQAYLVSRHMVESPRAGRYAFLEIADNGSGMDEDTLGKIFDPFFSTKCIGRGLGLASVLGIVRGHRGTIKVESTPGAGTVVRVLLPVSRGLSPRPSLSSPDADPWQGSGTILLADDEPSVREIGAQMLQRMGFTVLLASDGAQCIRVFRENSGEIVCVVLDSTMPGMTGEEACREIRKLDTELPILMSSGYAGREIEERVAGLNASGFLHKPYTMRELKEGIRRVLPDSN